MTTTLLYHGDLASTALGLLGSRSALSGVGAASRRLRAAVKASLTRLALGRKRLEPQYDADPARRAELRQQCEETVRESFPRLEEYPLLRHLHVHAGRTPAEAAQLAADIAAVGLPARLETFRLVSTPERRWTGNEGGHRALAELLTGGHVAWPQLRALDAGPDVPAFLDAMVAAPAAHCFPRLRSLGCEVLHEAKGRKLLALLDRGAFPALTALTPTRRGP